VPTAALGAGAHVAEEFAAGFLPPVLVRILEPVFSLSEGFKKFPSLCLVFNNFIRFYSKSHELRRRGKVRPGRDPRCSGKATVCTGGRHVPEHTV